jgi:hypothetical protein
MAHELSRRTFVSASGCALALSSPPAAGRILPSPWDHWTISNPDRTRSVDHSPLDEFLARYVTVGVGPTGLDSLLDYGRVSPRHHAALRGYAESLSAVPITQYRREEQFAFWVNLFGALVLLQILDAYPVDSIRDINPGGALFRRGPWTQKSVTVERFPLSLNDIEHRILRPIWREPRVHYVLNCGAMGCPHLPARALQPAETEAQLESAATAFVNHPRTIDVRFDGVHVSSIYAWYESDFGYGRADVMAHLRTYARGHRKRVLSGVDGWTGHFYDWRLNDTALFR